MAIPPRFLIALRERLTLSEIVGRRVRLARAGREFKGCCPFHQEKTPSFYVNDDKQFYHCFGCGAHGDAVGFLMQHDNLSFPEAVEALAPLAGLEVPQSSPREVEYARKEKDLYSLMDAAARFFEGELQKPGQREALGYLTGRGLLPETLAAFRIGFAPADGQVLRVHLKAAGYTDAQMMEVGVLRTSERSNEPYAFFRDRLMFPVADRRGRIVAFGGRILPEHLRPPDRGDYKAPKYINSSETPLFHKGRMLYGESHARTAAANGEDVIVVEGYMDVIACHQAGLRGAVAPMGTALTDEQILALWKMRPEPVLCFDGDEAGRRAAARAADNILPLLKPGHSARIAFLPQGQDPDSLVRGQGAEALRTVITAALPLADFLWESAFTAGPHQTPEARAALAQTLEDCAGKIADRGVQSHYRQAFRERVWNAFRSVPGKRKGAVPQVSPLQKRTDNTVMVCQLALLAATLNYPEIFDVAEEDIASLTLTDRRLDALRQSIIRALGDHSGLDAAGLETHLLGQGFEEELKLALNDQVYSRLPSVRPGLALERVQAALDDIRRVFERQTMLTERRAGMQDGSMGFHGGDLVD